MQVATLDEQILFKPLFLAFNQKHSSLYLILFLYIRKIYVLGFVSLALVNYYPGYQTFMNYMLIYPILSPGLVQTGISLVLSLAFFLSIQLFKLKKSIISSTALFYIHLWANVLQKVIIGLSLSAVNSVSSLDVPKSLSLSVVSVVNILLCVGGKYIYQFFVFTFSFNSQNCSSKLPNNLYILYALSQYLVIVLFVFAPLNSFKIIIILVIFSVSSIVELIQCFLRYPYFQRHISKQYMVNCSFCTIFTVCLLINQLMKISLMQQNILIMVGCAQILGILFFLNLRNYFVKSILTSRLQNFQNQYTIDLKVRIFYSMFRNAHVKKSELYLASFLRMHIDVCKDPACVCLNRNRLFDPKTNTYGSTGLQPHKDQVFVKHFLSKFLRDSKQKFKSSKLLVLDYVYYHFEVLRLYAKTMIDLKKFTLNNELTKHQQYCVYSLERKVSCFLFERNQRLSKDPQLQIEKAFKFEGELIQIQVQVFRMAQLFKKFYQQLVLKLQFEPIKNLCNQLLQGLKQTQNMYNQTIKVYNQSKALKFFMEIYCKEIAFDQVLSFKVSKNISALSQEINKTTFNNFSQLSCCLLVSTQPQSLGNILWCSKKIKYNFGYSSQDLLGVNISDIMPKFIGALHNEVMNSWLKRGQERKIGKIQQGWVSQKNGYLTPVKMIIKVLPMEKGFQLIGILMKDPQSEFILFGEDGTIFDISQVAYRKFFGEMPVQCFLGSNILIVAPKLLQIFVEYFTNFTNDEVSEFNLKFKFSMLNFKEMVQYMAKQKSVLGPTVKKDPIKRVKFLQSLKELMNYKKEDEINGQHRVKSQIRLHKFKAGQQQIVYYSLKFISIESLKPYKNEFECISMFNKWLSIARINKANYCKKVWKKKDNHEEHIKDIDFLCDQQNFNQVYDYFLQFGETDTPVERFDYMNGDVVQPIIQQPNISDQIFVPKSKKLIDFLFDNNQLIKNTEVIVYKPKSTKRLGNIVREEKKDHKDDREPSQYSIEKMSSLKSDNQESVMVMGSYEESVLSNNQTSVSNSKIKIIRQELKLYKSPSQFIYLKLCLLAIFLLVLTILVIGLVSETNSIKQLEQVSLYSYLSSSQLSNNLYMFTTIWIQFQNSLQKVEWVDENWLNSQRDKWNLLNDEDKLIIFQNFGKIEEQYNFLLLKFNDEPKFYQFLEKLQTYEKQILANLRDKQSVNSLTQQLFEESLPKIVGYAKAINSTNYNIYERLSSFNKGFFYLLDLVAVLLLILGLAGIMAWISVLYNRQVVTIELFKYISAEVLEYFKHHYQNIQNYLQLNKESNSFMYNQDAIHKASNLHSNQNHSKPALVYRMRDFVGLTISVKFILKPVIFLIIILSIQISLKIYIQQLYLEDIVQKGNLLLGLHYSSVGFMSLSTALVYASSLSAKKVELGQNLFFIDYLTDIQNNFKLSNKLSSLKPDELLDKMNVKQQKMRQETLGWLSSLTDKLAQTEIKELQIMIFMLKEKQSSLLNQASMKDIVSKSFQLGRYLRVINFLSFAQIDYLKVTFGVILVIEILLIILVCLVGGFFIWRQLISLIQSETTKSNAYILLIPGKVIQENQYLKAFIKRFIKVQSQTI